VLIASVVLAVVALASPRTLATDASGFDVARAMRHLEVLATEPRPVGSPGHEKARKYLLEELAKLGLEPTEQATQFAARLAGNVFSSDIRNVMGRLRGARGGGPAVLLVAHYDAVPQAPGASDDGSGVVTLLETARVLRAGPRLDNDVLFLFTDAEENGMLGAQAFVAVTWHWCSTSTREAVTAW
jgi:acetylornithine deacetylase/succinyl-diaminopimelate desuccinylase-like protein